MTFRFLGRAAGAGVSTAGMLSSSPQGLGSRRPPPPLPGPETTAMSAQTGIGGDETESQGAVASGYWPGTASSRSRRPWRTSRPLPPRRPPSGLKQVAPGQYPTSCLSSAAPSRAPGASRPRKARRVYAWRRAWWPQPARAPRRPARVGACPPSSTI